MLLSSLNTGSTDLRDTEVQQPNTTATLSLLISSRAFSANSGQFEAGIDDDGFELLAEQAALLVLLVDEHQHHVFQRRFADRHRAGERMENADFDRVFGLGGQRRRQAQGKTRRGCKPAAASRSLCDRAEWS